MTDYVVFALFFLSLSLSFLTDDNNNNNIAENSAKINRDFYSSIFVEQLHWTV